MRYHMEIYIKNQSPIYKLYYILIFFINLGLGMTNGILSILSPQSLDIVFKKFKKLTINRDLIVENRTGIFYVRKLTTDNQIISDYYEDELLPYFNKVENGLFIDVGANIGKWSIYMAKALGDHGRVLSIEPFIENYSILLKSILLNKCSNTIPLQIALSDTECEGAMIVEDSSNLGMVHLDKLGPEEHNVQVRLLDNVLSDLQIDISEISLLKIDVEGHELNVLYGCRGLLANCPRLKIIFESFENDIQEVENLLKEYEYNIYNINGNNYFAMRGK